MIIIKNIKSSIFVSNSNFDINRLDASPTLVHFSDDVPSVYYGDESSEAVIEWLVRQKTEQVIEDVTAEILTEYLMDEEEYLAVLFTGECR